MNRKLKIYLWMAAVSIVWLAALWALMAHINEVAPVFDL